MKRVSKKKVIGWLVGLFIFYAVYTVGHAQYNQWKFKQRIKENSASVHIPEPTSMSDEEYGKWFMESQKQVLDVAKEVVEAQNEYYNGFAQWELSYQQANDDLDSMYLDISSIDYPEDDQLSSLHDDYVYKVSGLLNEGKKAFQAYEDGDEEQMKTHFNNQRAIEQEILPIMQQVQDVFKAKGL